jgi:hypothetical protein
MLYLGFNGLWTARELSSGEKFSNNIGNYIEWDLSVRVGLFYY